MRALELIDHWPVTMAAAGVVTPDGRAVTHGAIDQVVRLASVSKLVSAWAILIAVEDGSVDLDGPVDPPNDAGTPATVRQLLSHAGGYPFDGPAQIIAPGRKRIYSNTGYEVLARHVATATGIAFDRYVREALFEPLGMSSAVATGSPAKDYRGALVDVVRLAAELLTPRLVAPATAAEATRVQFPELSGVVPGVGRFDPNPWGLGPEIRGRKQPHWTGTSNSPETFGHFGGSGTFLWVDPVNGLACTALTRRPFTEWGMDAWPAFSDAVIAEHAGRPPGGTGSP